VSDASFTFETIPQGQREVAEINRNLLHLGDLLLEVDRRGRATGEHLSHEFEGVGETLGGLKHRIEGALEFTGLALLIEGVHRLAEEFTELAAEAVKAAAAEESLAHAAEFTLGKEGSRDLLEYVGQIADLTPFTKDQLAKWSIELARAGVQAQEIPKFLAAAGDLAARSTDRVGTMGTALEALTRAQLRGIISSKELVRLRIGVDDLQALPEFAGKSALEIQKVLSPTAKGGANFGIAELFDIIAGKDKVLGDQLEQTGGEVNSLLTHLHERPERFFAELADTEGYQRLKEELSTLLSALDPESPEGRRIFEGLQNIFNAVSEFLGNADIPSLVVALTQTFEEFAYAFLGVLQLFPGTIGEAAAKAREELGLKLQVREMEEAGQIRTPNAKEERAIQSRLAAFEDEIDAEDQAAAAGTGVGEAFGGGVDQGVRDKLQIHSPSKVAEGWGENVSAGFTGGLESDAPSISALAGAISPAGGRGGVTLNFGPVYVTGHDAAAQADNFIEQLKRKLTAADLLDMVEDANLSQGGAP